MPSKQKKKELLKEFNRMKRVIYRGNTSIPVISSNNKEFNFYLGQVYNEKYPLPLQSKYWLKTKSSGQKFTIHPWDTNPSLPVTEDYPHIPSDFSQLKLNPNIIEQLRELGFLKPTPIQVLTIPRILEHKNLLLAAETGCGKTIAYLAPILSQLLSAKKSMKLFPDTPLALILVPGRELAEQIGMVAYKLCRNLNIDVGVVISEGTQLKHLSPKANSNVDLLVASIGTIARLFSKGVFKLSNLKHLVLDEADTLLDDSFIESVEYLLRHLPIQLSDINISSGAVRTQLIFASSIYPSNINSLFSGELTDNDIIEIKSPFLHRILPHVTQRFWRVNNDNRASELLHLVKPDYEKKKSVMIFCNKSPTCDWLSLFLEENGVPNVKFHGAVDPKQRSKVIQDFLNGYANVLCCTDLASRGLDTQRVKHVINFDFPNNISDYILRAGRVGRVGSNQGHVTSLIVSIPGVYTVQEIESAVKRSSRLNNVDSNIKRKIRKIYFNY